MRKDITIKVFESESVEGDLPNNPKAFLKFWQDKFDLVPETYKETTEITLEASEFYGSGILECKISYTRPETETETTNREAMENLKKARETQAELDEYRRLQAKFCQEV